MTLELFPYQEIGADFLARHERAGLFDEMGIGKTAQAIRAMDLRRTRRAIVAAPAAVRSVWVGEFRKFALMERRILKGVSIHDFMTWKRGRFDVLVTSYEMATKWAKHVAEMGEVLDLLVIDEGHYLKNDETHRARAFLGQEITGYTGIAGSCEQAWWLTGTPMPNDPLDSFTFLRFCNAFGLSRKQFTQRYFTSRMSTYGSRQTPILEMVPELRALLGNNMIARTQEQVGIQLPPIHLTSVEVDGDTTAIRDMLLQHPGLDRAIVEAMRSGGLSFLDAQHIMTLRRLIGEAKAVPYAHLLLEELRGGLDKAVVFGLHRAALATVRDFLARHGVGTAMVTGETLERDRGPAMERFQTDPLCRVFIGHIKAAGTGLTLTAASALDMLESDWSPGPNAQAIKRVHRISQTRNVRARFITLAKSFDETVNRIVAEKTAAIAMIEGRSMNAAVSPLTQ